MTRRRARNPETPVLPFFTLSADDPDIYHVISVIEFEWDTLGANSRPEGRLIALRAFRDAVLAWKKQAANVNQTQDVVGQQETKQGDNQ